MTLIRIPQNAAVSIVSLMSPGNSNKHHAGCSVNRGLLLLFTVTSDAESDHGTKCPGLGRKSKIPEKNIYSGKTDVDSR